jgi:hypothetical protein
MSAYDKEVISILEKRIAAAKTVAHRFGSIDGAHHKQWVIDQMMQAILSKEEYQQWLIDMVSEEGYEDDPWDPGIAP